MVTVNKPIEMICEHNANGKIKPIRLRIKQAGDWVTMDIKNCKVPEISRREKIIKYSCMVTDTGMLKPAEICFVPEACRWILNRIG